MKNLRVLLALFAGVALVGAACSDDDSDDTTTTTVAEDDAMVDEEMDVEDGAADEAPAGDETIVEIAAGNPDFSTLVELVTAAGLVETLSGDGPFTVFAPTNEAFAAVPAETLEALAADPQGALTEVLTLHVVAGNVMAADAGGLVDECVETVNGGSLRITETAGGLAIGGADIVATDIVASNGVIHVIDSVIVEPTADC